MAGWIDRKLFKFSGIAKVQSSLFRRMSPGSQEASVVNSLRPSFGLRDSNRRLNAQFVAAGKQVSALNWFVPYHENSLYAGVYTVLRFASRLASNYSIPTRIVIYDRNENEISDLRNRIESFFPALKGAVSSKPLDRATSIATFWKSAYFVAEMKGEANYYFIQDYEPAFYPAGSIYGLAENSYRLGLKPIVNTPGLLDFICKTHNISDGVSFIPTVAGDVFYPGKLSKADGPIQLVFYGRPSCHRNGFELGIEALAEVKRRFGAKVRILSAGEDWNPRQYGLENIVENKGRLPSISEVAELYRQSHIGLCFMFSKHPSYQPFEMIASGCVVVTNENEATSWFFRNGENCLVTPPTVSEVSSTLSRLIEDNSLRHRIQESAVATLSKQSWDEVIDEVCLKAGLVVAHAISSE
jgi:glycosyltransferase involved in cell wall biosynthesis